MRLRLVILCLLAAAGCGAEAPRRAERQAEPALPDAQDRGGWRALLQWSDDCEAAFQTSRAGDHAGVAVFPLARDSVLVQVLCAAGAYQPSSVYGMVTPLSQPRGQLLMFSTFESPDGTSVVLRDVTELTGESWFNRERHELSVLNFWRQTADCGVWTLYAIGEARAQLVDARAQYPCPSAPGEPARPENGAPPSGWSLLPRP